MYLNSPIPLTNWNASLHFKLNVKFVSESRAERTYCWDNPERCFFEILCLSLSEHLFQITSLPRSLPTSFCSHRKTLSLFMDEQFLHDMICPIIDERIAHDGFVNAGTEEFVDSKRVWHQTMQKALQKSPIVSRWRRANPAKLYLGSWQLRESYTDWFHL